MKKAKKKISKTKRMTARQYVNAITALGLTVAGKRTAEALGIGLRHCQRLAAGDGPIPLPVEKLLTVYLKHPDALPDAEDP